MSADHDAGRQNSLELVAAIVERNVLRYSPAGIPIIDFSVHHASSQLEAGQYRQVDLELKCVAVGEIASMMGRATDHAPLDRLYRLKGFLARRTKRSKNTVFHVTTFELNETDIKG